MAHYFPEIPEPPEDAVIATCTHCNGEIYAGEEYGEDEHGAICPDCVDAVFAALPLWAKCQVLGYERAGELCRR